MNIFFQNLPPTQSNPLLCAVGIICAPSSPLLAISPPHWSLLAIHGTACDPAVPHAPAPMAQPQRRAPAALGARRICTFFPKDLFSCGGVSYFFPLCKREEPVSGLLPVSRQSSWQVVTCFSARKRAAPQPSLPTQLHRGWGLPVETGQESEVWEREAVRGEP